MTETAAETSEEIEETISQGWFWDVERVDEATFTIRKGGISGKVFRVTVTEERS